MRATGQVGANSRTDTQHVPCKFFLQGQCQAGRMCPFSHNVESTVRPAVCKYFNNEGCKFGRKCALLHVAPDGTILNRGPPHLSAASVFQSTSTSSRNIPYSHAPPRNLLSSQAQGLESARDGETSLDSDMYHFGMSNGYDGPSSDSIYGALSPVYGSPHDGRFIGSSPGNGLSVLDAPLPSSFDSNGISLAARIGPFAASVPSRFGVESPPSSLPHKSQLGNTALRDLHSSAFGGRGMDDVLAGFSPPNGPDEALTFPKRSLYNGQMQATRNQDMISSSLGTKLPSQTFDYSDSEEGDSEREEDLLPASLRDLIPESRTRRSSRPRPNEDNTPASFLAAQRRTISTHGTPLDSKIGSPHSSSPSRFPGNIWARSTSGEGHFGSPLRNSGLTFTPSISTSRPNGGDLSPTFSSPPRQASMSMLTQELQRTKLDAARSHAAATTVGVTRTLSNGSTPQNSSDRASSSNGGAGRARIDEEQDVFKMEEVFDSAKTASAPRTIPRSGARSSDAGTGSAFYNSPGSGETGFGAIGGHRTAS